MVRQPKYQQNITFNQEEIELLDNAAAKAEMTVYGYIKAAAMEKAEAESNG